MINFECHAVALSLSFRAISEAPQSRSVAPLLIRATVWFEFSRFWTRIFLGLGLACFFTSRFPEFLFPIRTVYRQMERCALMQTVD